jgi:hypothetical protein
MLSIGKIGLGQERYYELKVAEGEEDYYSGEGEAEGYWLGRGAEELELTSTAPRGPAIPAPHPLSGRSSETNGIADSAKSSSHSRHIRGPLSSLGVLSIYGSDKPRLANGSSSPHRAPPGPPAHCPPDSWGPGPSSSRKKKLYTRPPSFDREIDEHRRRETGSGESPDRRGAPLLPAESIRLGSRAGRSAPRPEGGPLSAPGPLSSCGGDLRDERPGRRPGRRCRRRRA